MINVTDDDGYLHVVRLLREAGRDVELDQTRIRSIIDGMCPRAAATQERRRPAVDRPGRRRHLPGPAGRRPVMPRSTHQRGPMQIVLLPLAGALAAGLVVTVAGERQPGGVIAQVVAERPKLTPPVTPTPETTTPTATPSDLPTTTTSATTTTPPPTSTTPSKGTATSPGSGTSNSSGTTTTSSLLSVRVTQVARDSGFSFPLRAGGEWLVPAPATTEAQVHGPGGAWRVGPAQVLGPGQKMEPGPFQVSWPAGSAPSGDTSTRRWLVAPGLDQGVPTRLRIPVRVQASPSTITLLTGTVGGSGRITVSVMTPDGHQELQAAVPSCGQPACPALATVTFHGQLSGQSTAELLVDLEGSSPDAKVGLAAVELD